MKKMTFAFASFLLLLTLSACTDNDEETSKENSEPETTEPSGEAAPTEYKLELPQKEEVVVVVNGEEILGKVYNSVARQLESTLAAQGQSVSDEESANLLKEQALSVLIGNKVILQDAEEKGYKADDETVKERLEELKNQFETEEAMNKALKETGFTIEEMELQLREQLIYEQYVAEEVEVDKVTDEEVQAAYDGFVESSEAEAPPLKEMEPTIRQSLEGQKTQDALFAQIEELKKSAEIEINI
ncbi:peptidylprolyl isomerase [Planococcus donghaensis MPA1U2]|uniref:Peptidylprolyl isomerase n=1 Tax=Planococcus donghaensis MPA1U2 TaxID=933115 RepID=E7RDN3_9BACL|nr:SurA N-terminal domain-containing protein [Planococcus donghaensis]EGA90893.1 peptidylprolyl isomerase [Planococcus donghaensis MPA1U2]